MFDWNTYLSLAVDPSGHEDEASHRSAISRAYYCAYHHACTFAKQQGAYIPENKEGHGWVWCMLRNNPNARGGLGTLGDTPLQLRVKADYKPAIKLTRNDAKRAIDLAFCILRKLGVGVHD